jgi:hypothetical protein
MARSRGLGDVYKRQVQESMKEIWLFSFVVVNCSMVIQ